VRLFSLLAERYEPSLVLQRSLFVDLLDVAERGIPSLTPAAVVDSHPSMRPTARRAVVARR
jgi:nitrous oxidase accessory protein